VASIEAFFFFHNRANGKKYFWLGVFLFSFSRLFFSPFSMAGKLRELGREAETRFKSEVRDSVMREARQDWEREIFPRLQELAKEMCAKHKMLIDKGDHYVKALLVILLDNDFTFDIEWYKEYHYDGGGWGGTKLKIFWKVV
jgi:hypothetical protein